VHTRPSVVAVPSRPSGSLSPVFRSKRGQQAGTRLACRPSWDL